MKYDLTSLKVIVSGAAPLGGPLVKAVKDRLRSVGAECGITQGTFHRHSPLCHEESDSGD